MIAAAVYVALALVAFCYCIGKTIDDWQARRGWLILAGMAASLGALVFLMMTGVALIFGGYGGGGAYP